MLPLDVIAIEQEARRLRAIEIQRIEGLIWARLQVFAHSLASRIRSATAEIGSVLRPLFSSHHGTDRVRHCD
ncbi:MAG: hypothetical protein A2045_09810 [Rhodocyclales bacterium GWA2_65_20]|nr:MAG: hypothetical protein A2045_09810 [Rhodocyclales bacterium GWA2_65_20]